MVVLLRSFWELIPIIAVKYYDYRHIYGSIHEIEHTTHPNISKSAVLLSYFREHTKAWERAWVNEQLWLNFQYLLSSAECSCGSSLRSNQTPRDGHKILPLSHKVLFGRKYLLFIGFRLVPSVFFLYREKEERLGGWREWGLKNTAIEQSMFVHHIVLDVM